jgi:lipoprotein signal peptidase
MLTAYDYQRYFISIITIHMILLLSLLYLFNSQARHAENTGFEMVIVGDSLG